METHDIYFNFFIHDTYFGTIPKELCYVILSNLKMRNVCDTFGYDFYETHKLLFDIIIKRDFGENILTNLIDAALLRTALSSANVYTGKLRYNSFLERFKFYRTSFSVLKNNDSESYTSLYLKSIKLCELEKMGFKSIAHIYTDPEQTFTSHRLFISNNEYYITFYTKGNFDTTSHKITPNSLFNFLFFFDVDTIFNLKIE